MIVSSDGSIRRWMEWSWRSWRWSSTAAGRAGRQSAAGGLTGSDLLESQHQDLSAGRCETTNPR